MKERRKLTVWKGTYVALIVSQGILWVLTKRSEHDYDKKQAYWKLNPLDLKNRGSTQIFWSQNLVHSTQSAERQNSGWMPQHFFLSSIDN